jgi:hypothetical protein
MREKGAPPAYSITLQVVSNVLINLSMKTLRERGQIFFYSPSYLPIYLFTFNLSFFSCTKNSKAVTEIKESSVTSAAHAPYPNHNNLCIL